MVKIQTDTRREYKMEKKEIYRRKRIIGRETTRINYRKNKIYFSTIKRNVV